jgi:hypothetical protein
LQNCRPSQRKRMCDLFAAPGDIPCKLGRGAAFGDTDSRLC